MEFVAGGSDYSTMDVPLQFNVLLASSRCNDDDDDDADRHIFTFVDSLDEHRAFPSYDASQLKAIAAYVNSALDNDGDTLNGLSLLAVVVEQSSTDVFAEFHLSWVQSLIRTLFVKTPDPGVRLLASETLALVFEHASNFPEFVRYLATSVVPQLILQLLSTTEDDVECQPSDAVLLLAVLRHFPGACRAHVQALRKRIINLLLLSRSVVSTAAKCLSLLPWVGLSPSTSGKKLSSDANWTKLYAQLCGSLHLILDVVYEGYEKGRKSSNPDERLEQSLFHKDVSCRTLISLLMCVREMLTVNPNVEPPFARVVPIEDTMALVCRILNVNFNTMVKRREVWMLDTSLSLPEIHRITLSVLDRLLTICGRHMSLHGTSVLGIVAKTLLWTSEISSALQQHSEAGIDHPLGRLRVASYDVLVTWLDVVHSPSALAAVEAPLIRNLLSDVTPKTTEASMTLVQQHQQSSNSGSRQRSKKKAKRDFAGSSVSVDVVHRKVRPWSDSQLCLAALDALNVVLCHGAEVLQTRFLKNIHEQTLKVCRKVQSVVPIPYGDPACRQALYELLLATVVHRTPSFAPDLSACIGVFSRGITLDSSCRQVARSCARSLATCHLLTNPHRPSMYAVDLPRQHEEESTMMEISTHQVISNAGVSVANAVVDDMEIAITAPSNDWSHSVTDENVGGAKSTNLPEASMDNDDDCDCVEVVFEEDRRVDQTVSKADIEDDNAIVAATTQTDEPRVVAPLEVDLCDTEELEDEDEEDKKEKERDVEGTKEGLKEVSTVERLDEQLDVNADVVEPNHLEEGAKKTDGDHSEKEEQPPPPPPSAIAADAKRVSEPPIQLKGKNTAEMISSFVDCVPDA